MTLRHMKIFVAVCECGSVTAAASRLYIAQPAASLAISELENYYGVRLFDRISNRLHITETGRMFLQYASHIVSLFDEMEQGIRNWDSAGLLRVGASITIGNCLLPEYVEQFQNSHPQIQVRAVIDNSGSIEQCVLENQIDFGLIEGQAHSPYIQSYPFLDDRLVLICAPSHPWVEKKEISFRELKEGRFLLREKGSAGREIFDALLRAYDTEITPLWQSVSTQSILRAVEKGLGVSVLPYLLVQESLDSGRVCPVALQGESLRRQFSVICHRNKFLTESALDFLSLCFGESLPGGMRENR